MSSLFAAGAVEDTITSWSEDGISYSPKEYSRPTDIENGANVLLHTILEIDRGL